MARTESEQLVFSVEARIAAMEKQMARAGRTVDTTFTGMERRSKRAAQTMEKEMASGAARVGSVMKNFGKGLFAGVVAGGVVGVVSQMRQVATGIAEIGDEAKRAGVSAKAFQEWKFVAQQNRIGVDQMADALKELNLRADEFVATGKGAAADAFARLGYSAANLGEKLKDPSALMLEIIGRLGKMEKAAQMRIADELFGGSAGERFVQLLDQGEAGIRQTMERAHELGAVLDDEMIKKAAEIDRRFKEISTTVGMTLKSAIVSAADSLAEFIDGFRAFENRRDHQLTSKIADLGRSRLEIERQMIDIREMQRNMVPDASGGYTWAAELGRWQAELDRIAADEARIGGILNSRSEAMKRSADRTWTPPNVPASPTSKAGGGHDNAAAAAEREADAVRRLIADLEEELRLVGATDLERETSNVLRQAGAAATADQKAQIVSLVTALYAEEEATRKATEAAQELRDIGRDVLGGMISDLKQGKNAADILANALDRVGDRLLNLALDGLFSPSGGGGGGFLSAIGKLFGFSKGGYTGTGGKDVPAGVVHRGEYVFSKKAVERLGAGYLDQMHRAAKGYASGGLVRALPGGEAGAELCFGQVPA